MGSADRFVHIGATTVATGPSQRLRIRVNNFVPPIFRIHWDPELAAKHVDFCINFQKCIPHHLPDIDATIMENGYRLVPQFFSQTLYPCECSGHSLVPFNFKAVTALPLMY